jgi:anti-sigma regulatory factor (Ser/Thr protein kinase)
MTGVRARGEDIRRYILENIEKYPKDISRRTAEKFGISRQAVNKHLQRLTEEKAITETGQTRSRSYQLSPLAESSTRYDLTPDLAEDVVWTKDIRPALDQLPDNVMELWHHGFTEMFNNAKEHSDGTLILVHVKKSAAKAEMWIIDNGVGIFRKIQAAMSLLDERHAVLELAKGKFTTDPSNHSGEGIFFSSRMFDYFAILSGGVSFSHQKGNPEDWIAERDGTAFPTGTSVYMELNNHTSRTTRKVFDEFTSDDEEYRFDKTVVPVRLAKYGDDNLISRSQAKRLLARVELFKIVLLDFNEVPAIGQAFADEIFRVFANRHPEIELVPVNASSAVRRMIERAKSGGPPQPGEEPSQ